MALTDPQLAALKQLINGDAALSSQPNDSDGNTAIARALDAAATPPWTVWRKSVPLSEIAKKINGAELAGLTSLNNTRLQTIVTLINAAGGLDASLADQRAFFDDVFSGAGGTTTRASLLALWKKPATRAQKLFTTGTGSNASPATTDDGIGDTFSLTYQNVEAARNLP